MFFFDGGIELSSDHLHEVVLLDLVDLLLQLIFHDLHFAFSHIFYDVANFLTGKEFSKIFSLGNYLFLE